MDHRIKMNDLVYLKLSIQKALLGYVTPELRSVHIQFIDQSIHLYFVIDGKPSDYWQDAYTEIGTEVIADYAEPYSIQEHLLQIDFPNCITLPDTTMIYRRYENHDK